MVDDFIARKHSSNQAEIDYLHPDLEPVLEETYGVMIYQEDVMRTLSAVAGMTLAVGVVIGGFLGAMSAGRFQVKVEKGPSISTRAIDGPP